MTRTALGKGENLSGINKFERRRGQLALSALTTLSELGYARTSLRDIARNSDFSHGILHYYFRDKVDLITYCVRYFSAMQVARYDGLVAAARNSDELKSTFSSAVSIGLLADEEIHRTWYDLRNQSLFDASLRADVTAIDEGLQSAIWRVVTRYAEMSSKRIRLPEDVTYAAFDGLIYQALTRNSGSIEVAVADLHESVESLLLGVVR